MIDVNNSPNQEIFDFVYEKLKEQGEAATKKNVGCVYRGPGGTKCALGHLIPDEKYNPTLEDITLTGVLHSQGWSPLLYDFLNELQCCHDGAIHAPDFISEFLENAHVRLPKYDVEVPND